jgi:hypothetical protein
MANHERPYDIPISFIHPKTKLTVEYKMRESIWSFDMSLQQKTADPEGNLNAKELWISRMLDCIEGMDDKTIRSLDQYTMNVLCSKWLEYNDPNSNFLGVNLPEGSQTNTIQ